MKKQVATQSHVSAQKEPSIEISFNAFDPVKVHHLTLVFVDTIRISFN